jgi:hypothetical protein
MEPWAAGVPLYVDPDVRFARGDDHVQYTREMVELIDEEDDTDPDDPDWWMFEESAYRYVPGLCGGFHFAWQQPMRPVALSRRPTAAKSLDPLTRHCYGSPALLRSDAPIAPVTSIG